MPSWRDTLFFWRGTIEDATWSGTWVGVNSAKGAAGAMPSEEQFAGSANKFALTLERADGAALAAAQVTRRALPDALTARAHTRGAGAPAGSERARGREAEFYTPLEVARSASVFKHPGVALLWVPTLGSAPARTVGRCVFEERVGVGVHNARVAESTDDLT